MVVSSAETIGNFNTGFETVKLQRPTMSSQSLALAPDTVTSCTTRPSAHRTANTAAVRERETRVSVFEEAPGFRLGLR